MTSSEQHVQHSVLSLDAAKDHLALLAVGKPSVDDCSWIRIKAKDLFDFVGADLGPEESTTDDTARRRSDLIALGASESLFHVIEAMAQCAGQFESGKYPEELAETAALLLRVLRNLARDPGEGVRLLNELDAARRIRDVVMSFMSSPTVVRDGFGVLTNLAAPASNRQRVFSECGALLVAGMKRHSGDAQVAQNGCGCLVNLANDVTHLDEMGEVAAAVLVETGMLHAKNERVAENVESALAALLIEKSNATRLLNGESSTTVDCIVNLVRLHPKNAVVCEHGMRCVYSLAQTQEHKPVLMRSNALLAVQMATTECATPSAAEWGCKAVKALSHSNVEIKVQLQEQGGVGFVLHAIRAHNAAQGVVKAGLSALWSLANASKNKAPMVLQAGAHQTIVNALRLLPDSRGVGLTGTAALASLANEPLGRKAMLKDGALAAVIGTMRAHSGHALVCEHGCGFIWAMCMDREVQAAATRDAQAAKALVQALTLHPNRPGVMGKGLGALEVLSASTAGADGAVTAGVVPVLSSLLKVHLGKDPVVVLRTCHVLAIVAHYCDDLEVFHRYGVAEIAVDVQRAQPDDDRCSRAAERLLTALEGGTRTLLPI